MILPPWPPPVYYHLQGGEPMQLMTAAIGLGPKGLDTVLYEALELARRLALLRTYL
jgi:hypothetical protein